MRTVNIYEAKTHLSRLLDEVQAGEEIVIARAGRPIAELRAHEPRAERLVIGGLAELIEYDEAEFERPDPEILEMFYGERPERDDPAR